MASADYTRLAQYLPAVYQDDAASFAQIDAFLGLADELNHAYLERLDDLSLVLGPDAALRWPTDLPLDAGRDALARRVPVRATTRWPRWAAFAFPAVVGARRGRRRAAAHVPGQGGPDLAAPRHAARVPRLVLPGLRDRRRRRGRTCSSTSRCPVRRSSTRSSRGTLFVPSTSQFSDYRRRHEAVGVRRLVRAGARAAAGLLDPPGLRRPGPARLPADPTPEQVAAFQAAVDLYRADLRALLCSITSFIDHANGIRIWECIDEGRSIDRLDVGHLPSED